MRSTTIIHISTVHNRYDNRITNKECTSLAKEYKVILIVADGKKDEDYQGFFIKNIGKASNRFTRMLFFPWKAFFNARKFNPVLIHFHDPELIIPAFFFRIFYKYIIYDIHEDYITSIKHKSYLPGAIKTILILAVKAAEFLCKLFFINIIAENYYERRFPKAIKILNYPENEKLVKLSCYNPAKQNFIYTGNITEDRGALLMAKLAGKFNKGNFTFIGKCSEMLAEKMMSITNKKKRNIEIIGINSFVPFNQIIEQYNKGWIAGMAIFPCSPHYAEKELTKLFEYMAVGLPVIASDFPVWKSLVEGNGIGICVPPNDLQKQKDALQFLIDNPQKAAAMGKRGKSLVKKEFNWQNEEKKLLALYSYILNKS